MSKRHLKLTMEHFLEQGKFVIMFFLIAFPIAFLFSIRFGGYVLLLVFLFFLILLVLACIGILYESYYSAKRIIDKENAETIRQLRGN